MKNELFCPGFCRFMRDWNQRGIWFLKQLYCLFKSIDQALSEPYFFLLIPRSGFFQFRCSFPADSYFQNYQPLIRSLARDRTSFASRSSVSPESICWILRRISRSHASATPSSAGPSRLATRSLAKAARSCSESIMAAFLRVSSSSAVILHPVEIDIAK